MIVNEFNFNYNYKNIRTLDSYGDFRKGFFFNLYLSNYVNFFFILKMKVIIMF